MQPADTSDIKFYRERDEFGEFSNFYRAEIELDGKTWPTTEHYFQAQKYIDIDPDYVERIRTAKSPMDSKNIARSKSKKRRDDWDQVKYGVMVKALQAKFTQHPNLKSLLLSTGDRNLIENSADDYTWGCGKDGTGKNWLGKALMEVRAQLKEKKDV